MREKKENRRYLTTSQAARLAHLSPSTLLRAVQNKKMKAFSTPGGHFRVDPASLEAFLRESGLRNEKRKVLLLRLSPSERDRLLEQLGKDDDFALTETEPSENEKPCLVFLDASAGGARGKKERDLYLRLRRWCGMN